jgi:YbgC/YbaW family acyl-CoA thioester hydrolase
MMTWHHSATRIVDFSDTDMAGIVHFSKYFCYIEFAEHEFFRKLGFSVAQKYGDLQYGWPRVKVTAEFLSPLRFEDELEIRLRLNKISSRSIGFEFSIAKKSDQTIAAKGSYTTVCVVHNSDGGFRSAHLPEELSKLFKSLALNAHREPIHLRQDSDDR